MNEKLWNGNKNHVKLRISFYGRTNVIQIGKDVVRVLGAPPFVAMRVNQDRDSLLIESTMEKNNAVVFSLKDAKVFVPRNKRNEQTKE